MYDRYLHHGRDYNAFSVAACNFTFKKVIFHTSCNTFPLSVMIMEHISDELAGKVCLILLVFPIMLDDRIGAILAVFFCVVGSEK